MAPSLNRPSRPNWLQNGVRILFFGSMTANQMTGVFMGGKSRIPRGRLEYNNFLIYLFFHLRFHFHFNFLHGKHAF